MVLMAGLCVANTVFEIRRREAGGREATAG
jgi:hypothetical protein